ncbi:MAG: glycosyltransferase family 4 protein [Mucilaginibacter sp.]
MKKLAIITTHPIQYYAPVFKLLHQRGNIDLKVFYTLGDADIKYDPGFGKDVSWDIPLLEGYPYQWIENISGQPGTHHFKGIINPALIRDVETWGPDAILVFGWAYKSHLKVIRYFKNKMPVYFRGDSTLLDDVKGVRRLAKIFFLKWLYNHINHVFYVGANNKLYFKRYGLSENKLSFAPHAVENDRFSISRDDEVRKFKQELGICDTDITILFAGKFENKKSPGLLLNAFMTANIPHTRLLFVGDGALANTLKAAAGGNTQVSFMEFQNQSAMPVVYQSCDLFCLPSAGPGETWGLAVNEAMACGKAVLVSDKVGCAADLVKEGINGSIFRSGDVQDLIEKLQALTTDKYSLTQMGKQSQHIIKRYSFLHITEAIEHKLQNETN